MRKYQSFERLLRILIPFFRLMQALEALAKREGRRTHADAALLDWVAQMSERELH